MMEWCDCCRKRVIHSGLLVFDSHCVSICHNCHSNIVEEPCTRCGLLGKRFVLVREYGKDEYDKICASCADEGFLAGWLGRCTACRNLVVSDELIQTKDLVCFRCLRSQNEQREELNNAVI